MVTRDYIGPDRRRDPSRNSAPCFPVPNALRTKCALGLSEGEADEALAAELREGKRVVAAEKLRRDVREIYFHWNTIGQRQPKSRDFTGALSEIKSLASEIARRAPGTPFAAAADVGRALSAAAQTATAVLADKPGTERAALMAPLAEAVAALQQVVPPETGESAAAEGAASHAGRRNFRDRPRRLTAVW